LGPAQVRRLKDYLPEFLVVLSGRIGLGLLSLVFLMFVLGYLDQTAFGTYTLLFSTASWLSMLVFGAANVPMTRLTANAVTEQYLNRLAADMALWAFVATVPFFTVSAFIILVGLETEISQLGRACFVGLLGASIGATGIISTYAIGLRRRMLNAFILNGQVAFRILAIFIVGTAAVVRVDVMFAGVSLSAILFFIGLFLYLKTLDTTILSPLEIVQNLQEKEFLTQSHHSY